MGLGFYIAVVPSHAVVRDRGILSVPSINADTPYVESTDARRWTLSASGCPSGRRNANADECLHAIEEAVVGMYVVDAFKVLTNFDNAKEGGWSSGIPSGCSYSDVTQRAIFNHNQTSTSFHDVKDNYRHVCTNDDRATGDTDGKDTAPRTLPSPSPSPLPSHAASPQRARAKVRGSPSPSLSPLPSPSPSPSPSGEVGAARDLIRRAETAHSAGRGDIFSWSSKQPGGVSCGLCGRQDSTYECLTEIESEEYGCDEGIKGQCRWLGLATAQAKCMSWPRCEAIMSDVGDDWWFARGVFNNSIDSVSECTDGVATRRHYQKVLPPHSSRRGVDQPAPGCVSLQPALDNEWCDMNCQVMPDAASCKGYCHCPPGKAAAPPKTASSRAASKATHEKTADKPPSKVAPKHASTAPTEGTPSKPFAPWAEKAAKEKAAVAEKAAKGSSMKPKAAHCTSLNPTMDAAWCDMNCQVMPEASSCLGFCLCPPLEVASAPVSQGGRGSHRSVPPSPPRSPTWTAPPPPMPPIDYTIERSGHVQLSPAPSTPPWWTAPPPPMSPAVAKKERADVHTPSPSHPPASPWYAAPDVGPWSKEETEAKAEAEAEAAAGYEIEAEAEATARIEAAAEEEAAEMAAKKATAQKVAANKAAAEKAVAERAAAKKAALERAKAEAEEAEARDEAEAEIEAQAESEVEAEAEAAAKAEAKAVCTSLNPVTPAVWCDANCQLQPDAESCSGFCKCPKRSASDGAVGGGSGVVYGPDGAAEELREPEGPPPPEPRIIGGWTDCGDHDWTELSDMAKARASSASARQLQHQRLGTRAIDCVEEEKAISSYLPSQRGSLPHRNPSYEHSWGSSAILPGTFGGSTVAPIVGSPEQYEYFWLTFGGENTQSSGWGQNAERDILEAGARGAAFDMEGGVTPDAMMVFIKEMRPKHPDWTFVYVPNAGEEAAAIPYDTKNKGLPDYVAPMLYAGNWNSYPGQDITNGEDSISGLTLQRLKQVGWPASRTILTYQSFDAARMRQEAKGGLLPLLGKLLGDYSVEVGGGQKVHLQGPYAGVLGWPAQCGAADFRCWPTADRANIKQVIEGARSAGVGGAALKKPSSDSEPPAPPSAPTPPVPRGRCGPLFGGAKCDCSRGEDGGLALWCSSASYCGDTDEHQTDGMPAYDCPKAASAAVAAGGAKGGGDHGARPKPAPQKKCGPDNGGGRCDCSVSEDGRRALYCSSYGWCGDTPEYRDGSPDHDCIQYQQQEEKANFFDGYNSGAAAFGGAPTSETEEARLAAAKARAAAAAARAKVTEAKARAHTAEARALAAAAAASMDADR